MQNFGTNPADSLIEEHRAVTSLLELLKQEQEHLINADIDGLSKLTEEKTRILAYMSELAARRYKLVAAAGFDANESGMQSWLKSPAATATANQSWNELLAHGRSAKEQNRINGLLIGQHMTRNQNALNTLQGNPQGGNFYGPNGQATSRPTTRGLIVG